MGVAHVGLVHRDPCECKVKGFRAVSSIERNVSNRRHLQGVRQVWTENIMSWLGWVHRLQDRKTLISKAQHELKKYAAKSGGSCKLVDTAMKRFKSLIRERE